MEKFDSVEKAISGIKTDLSSIPGMDELFNHPMAEIAIDMIRGRMSTLWDEAQDDSLGSNYSPGNNPIIRGGQY